MALGIAVGSVIGMIVDNVGAWIPIGLALGAGIGARLDHINKKKEQ